MLDIFSDLKQSNASNGLGNIAVIVEGYEISSKDPKDHYVYGKNFVTGEDIKVTLDIQRIQKASNGSQYAPPSIAVFCQGDVNSNKFDNRIVKPGGIILFSSVFDNNGMLSGSWAIAMKHNNKAEDKESKASERTIVMFAPANMTFGLKKQDGKPYFVMRALFENENYYQHLDDFAKPFFSYSKANKPIAPKAFDSIANLKKYAAILFDKGFGFLLRANSAETVAGTINIEPPRFNENGKTGTEIAEDRLKDILPNVEALLTDKQLVNVEVIPYIQVWGGQYTQDDVFNELTGVKKTALRRLRRYYQEFDENGNFLTARNGETALYVPSFVKIVINGNKFGETHNEDGSFKGFTYGGVCEPQLNTDSYRGIENAVLFTNTEYAPDMTDRMKEQLKAFDEKRYYTYEEMRALRNAGNVQKDGISNETKAKAAANYESVPTAASKAQEDSIPEAAYGSNFAISDDDIPF